MSKQSMWNALWVLLAILVLISLFGCTQDHGSNVTDWNPFHGNVPPSLKGTDHMLGWFIGAAVLTLAGAATAFFMVPAGHKLAVTVGVGALSTIVVCLIVKVTLPFILPIAIGLLASAVGWSIYRIVKHRPLLPDLDGDGKSL